MQRRVGTNIIRQIKQNALSRPDVFLKSRYEFRLMEMSIHRYDKGSEICVARYMLFYEIRYATSHLFNFLRSNESKSKARAKRASCTIRVVIFLKRGWKRDLRVKYLIDFLSASKISKATCINTFYLIYFSSSAPNTVAVISEIYPTTVASEIQKTINNKDSRQTNEFQDIIFSFICIFSFSSEDRHRLATQSASALAYLHSKGIVHGLLSSSSIYCIPRKRLGDSFNFKLSQYGFRWENLISSFFIWIYAKLFFNFTIVSTRWNNFEKLFETNEKDFFSHITECGSDAEGAVCCGFAMSPERLASRSTGSPFTSSVDTWSLGLLLLETSMAIFIFKIFSVNDIFQNVLIEELWPFTQYVSVLQGCVLKGNI